MEWISFRLAVIEQLGLWCFLCFLFERLPAGMVSVCTLQCNASFFTSLLSLQWKLKVILLGLKILTGKSNRIFMIYILAYRY